MKTSFAPFAFLMIAVTALGVDAQRRDYPVRPPADPAAVERGKALYGVNCQFCHGADTRGGDSGPSLLRSGTVLDDQQIQRTVDVPRVAELSRRFLQTLGYVGVASAEFKYDGRDDTYRLIEVNPRAVSGNELAVAAGIDLPYLSYVYLVQGAVPAWEQRWDVHWINELRDLETLLRETPTRRAAAREWVRSLRHAEAFALGAWDDPAPLLGAFGGAAYRKVAGRLGLERPRVRSGRRIHESLEPAEAPAPRVAD